MVGYLSRKLWFFKIWTQSCARFFQIKMNEIQVFRIVYVYHIRCHVRMRINIYFMRALLFVIYVEIQMKCDYLIYKAKLRTSLFSKFFSNPNPKFWKLMSKKCNFRYQLNIRNSNCWTRKWVLIFYKIKKNLKYLICFPKQMFEFLNLKLSPKIFFFNEIRKFNHLWLWKFHFIRIRINTILFILGFGFEFLIMEFARHNFSFIILYTNIKFCIYISWMNSNLFVYKFDKKNICTPTCFIRITRLLSFFHLLINTIQEQWRSVGRFEEG